MENDASDALEQFERRLEAAQEQIRELQKELVHLRIVQRTGAADVSEQPAHLDELRPSAPPTSPTPSIETVERVRQPDLPMAVPASEQPIEQRPPAEPTIETLIPVEPPAEARRQINWEAIIGENWLNRIGVLILILAGAFLAHLSWQQGWVRPAFQVTTIFVSGAALIVAGEVFQRRKLPVFAQGLTALGIFALYGGGLVGYHLHGLFDENTTRVIYMITTACAFGLAVRADSVAVVLLGMLGGYLTPMICRVMWEDPQALFTYLLFLNIGIGTVSIARRWDFLNPIAFFATALMFGLWYFAKNLPYTHALYTTMLALHGGVFVLTALVPFTLLNRLTPRFSLWTLAKASLAFFGVVYLIYRVEPDHRLGEFAMAYAAGHWIVAGLIYSVRRREDPVLAYLLGLGAVFLTLAVPIYFSGERMAIAWAAQALVFTALGLRYGNIRTVGCATIVYMLAIWWTSRHDILSTAARGEWWGLDARFATAALVAAFVGLGGLAWRFGQHRIASLPNVKIPYLPPVFAAVADLILVAAAVHQFHDHALALAWTVNAFVYCACARCVRSESAIRFGLLLFAPAVVRFIAYQVLDAPAEDWIGGVDLRFAQGLFVVGAMWLAATIARLDWRQWHDLPDHRSSAVLAGSLLLFPVLSLQFEDDARMIAWAINVLPLAALASRCSLFKLAHVSSILLAGLVLWWLGQDVIRLVRPEPGDWLRQGTLGGLAIVASGWLTAWLFRRRIVGELSTIVAQGANLVLLVLIGHQWDGYAVLSLCALDVAILWTVGFGWRHVTSRVMALVLWIIVPVAWMVQNELTWQGSLETFVPLFNPRFGSLAFVAAIGLVATWVYRRFNHLLGQDLDERPCHLICVILANLLLAAAMTLDVDTYFDRIGMSGQSPFENLEMARQASFSVLWTSYAAVLFIVGFITRYRPVRILAMVALAPILVKVFMVDLQHLELIYRVLSFAVLGVVFIGISFLYQKYRTRISGATE